MGDIVLAGSTSGTTTLTPAAVSGTTTLTLPATTDTLVGKTTTDTLTNKSIVATQLTGTIDAARLPAGSVLQVVQTLNNANTSGSVIIPNDNTIPQITEGTQYLTCTIVPKRATSNLLVQVMLYISEPTNTSDIGAIALFRDATASAIAVGALGRAGSSNMDGGWPGALSILTPSNSTSSTTFTVRAGLSTANAFVMNTNADGASPKYGGVYYSGITIIEVAV